MSTFSDRPTSWLHLQGRQEGAHQGSSGFNVAEWRSTDQLSTTSLAHMSAPASSSSYAWQPLAWEPSPTGGPQPSLPPPAAVDGAVSPTAITAALPYSDQGWPTTREPHPAPPQDWGAFSHHFPSSTSPSFSPSAPYEVALASPPPQVFTLPAHPSPRRPIPLRRQTSFHVKAEPPFPPSAPSSGAWSNAPTLTQPQQRWSLHSHPASYQVLRPTSFDVYNSSSLPPPPSAPVPSSASRLWAPEQHARAQSWDGSNLDFRLPTAQHGWDAIAATLPLLSPGLPAAPSDQPPPLAAVVDNPRGSWSTTEGSASPLPISSTEPWVHSPAPAPRPELFPPLKLGSSLGLTELSDTPPSPPPSTVQPAVKAKIKGSASSKRSRKPKRRKAESVSSSSAPRKHVCELCRGRVAFSRPSALRTHLVSFFFLCYSW